MIVGFDHVVIAVRDLAASTAAYETVLGRTPSAARDVDGAVLTALDTSNVAVELMAPVGEGDVATRLRAALDDGEGLKSIVFATGDLSRAHRRCERVGLAPSVITERPNRPGSFRLDTERTHGVRIFIAEHAPRAPRDENADGVLGLDHIVIRTGDPERAAALYGARMGLDMRLDRDIGGRRLMFLRCGDAVVEVVTDPALAGARDAVWGLSWRVRNADAAHARLAAAGINVSEVRQGLKPGTRVFTVRDRTCGVPTLMIEASVGPD